MHRDLPPISSGVSNNPLYNPRIEFTPSSLAITPSSTSSMSPPVLTSRASIPPTTQPKRVISPPSIPPGIEEEFIENEEEPAPLLYAPQLIWRNSTPLPSLTMPFESTANQRHATCPDVRPKKMTFSDLRRQAGLNWSKTNGEYVNAQMKGHVADGDPEWSDSPLVGGKKNMVPVSIEKELNSQSRYKTELCRSFQETGQCRYGIKCQFAHGQEELRPVLRHPKYKTEICKTFSMQGVCPYGNRCRFIHTHAKSEIGANSVFIPPRAGNSATPPIWKDVVQKKTGKYISSQVRPPPGVSIGASDDFSEDSQVVEDDPPSDPSGSEIRLRPSPRGAEQVVSAAHKQDIKSTSNVTADGDGISWSRAGTYADPWKSAPTAKIQPRRKETSISPTPFANNGRAAPAPVVPSTDLPEDDPSAKGETRRRGSSGSRLPIFQQLTEQEMDDYLDAAIPDENLAGSVKDEGLYVLSHSH